MQTYTRGKVGRMQDIKNVFPKEGKNPSCFRQFQSKTYIRLMPEFWVGKNEAQNDSTFAFAVFNSKNTKGNDREEELCSSDMLQKNELKFVLFSVCVFDLLLGISLAVAPPSSSHSTEQPTSICLPRLTWQGHGKWRKIHPFLSSQTKGQP